MSFSLLTKECNNLIKRALSYGSARYNAAMPVLSLDKALDVEESRFLKRIGNSQALHKRAVKTIPGGVGSCWANSRPAPVWVERGEGAYVWDVDGNRYIDFHAGYGANIVGHAHPALVSAIQKRVTLGTHFAQPSRDMLDVSEDLERRFGLPKWR